MTGPFSDALTGELKAAKASYYDAKLGKWLTLGDAAIFSRYYTLSE